LLLISARADRHANQRIHMCFYNNKIAGFALWGQYIYLFSRIAILPLHTPKILKAD
jgi:hypothetical protein